MPKPVRGLYKNLVTGQLQTGSGVALCFLMNPCRRIMQSSSRVKTNISLRLHAAFVLRRIAACERERGISMKPLTQAAFQEHHPRQARMRRTFFPAPALRPGEHDAGGVADSSTCDIRVCHPAPLAFHDSMTLARIRMDNSRFGSSSFGLPRRTSLLAL